MATRMWARSRRAAACLCARMGRGRTNAASSSGLTALRPQPHLTQRRPSGPRPPIPQVFASCAARAAAGSAGKPRQLAARSAAVSRRRGARAMTRVSGSSRARARRTTRTTCRSLRCRTDVAGSSPQRASGAPWLPCTASLRLRLRRSQGALLKPPATGRRPPPKRPVRGSSRAERRRQRARSLASQRRDSFPEGAGCRQPARPRLQCVTRSDPQRPH
mmetsp:Transcript_44986/g.115038  ORF Transcript_44986/g.115038 Transcript_44986/m.115038 type:complete len:218 (+) Transcript_44986:740-1393(+)